MNDNQKDILQMVAENKITVEEAQRLLELVGKQRSGAEQEREQEQAAAAAAGRRPKYLRVCVEPGEGQEASSANKVNIRVPLSLIRAGMKLTSLIPSSAVNQANDALKEKGIDMDLNKIKYEDLEPLVDALSELEIDVKDGKEKVRVYVE